MGTPMTKPSTRGRSASSASHQAQSQLTTMIKTLTLAPSPHRLAVVSASVIGPLSTSCTTSRPPTATTPPTNVPPVVLPTLIAASGTPTCGPNTTLTISAVTRTSVSRISEHVNSLNKATLF